MLSEFNKYMDMITIDLIRDTLAAMVASPLALPIAWASALFLIGTAIFIRGRSLGRAGIAEAGLWIMLVTLSLTTFSILILFGISAPKD
jgi:hypothetical protein